MKARIKKTGEIINIASYAVITLDVCDSWGSPIEMKPEEIELIQDKTDDFDWQTFRAEATKDILCHLLNDRYSGDGDNHSLVMQAIGIADELVKQLKEKEEK